MAEQALHHLHEHRLGHGCPLRPARDQDRQEPAIHHLHRPLIEEGLRFRLELDKIRLHDFLTALTVSDLPLIPRRRLGLLHLFRDLTEEVDREARVHNVHGGTGKQFSAERARDSGDCVGPVSWESSEQRVEVAAHLVVEEYLELHGPRRLELYGFHDGPDAG